MPRAVAVTLILCARPHVAFSASRVSPIKTSPQEPTVLKLVAPCPLVRANRRRRRRPLACRSPLVDIIIVLRPCRRAEQQNRAGDGLYLHHALALAWPNRDSEPSSKAPLTCGRLRHSRRDRQHLVDSAPVQIHNLEPPPFIIKMLPNHGKMPQAGEYRIPQSYGSRPPPEGRQADRTHPGPTSSRITRSIFCSGRT